MPPLIIIVFIGLFIVIGVFGYLSTLKRRQAMMALAAKLGLNFYYQKDWDIPRRYRFLDKLRQGRDRYAFNILTGNYRQNDVTIFDYHYKTGSGKDTHHHYLSFFLLSLPASFPELVIVKEGFFSKIGQALGYDDIDFESHEFSRKFCVRSKDKKFAYDVCNARMIEYLLSNTDLSIEIEDNILAISFNRRLSPEYIEPNLNRLIKIRELLPDYLFARR
ncbi:MAG: DUF3137 domain-containing protein [Sedimentisphaerales bacterium]|nr:DUF3137 domain-containing protein [Sedimentisphaerales bacterium]